jgi:hypothetical protein
MCDLAPRLVNAGAVSAELLIIADSILSVTEEAQ